MNEVNKFPSLLFVLHLGDFEVYPNNFEVRKPRPVLYLGLVNFRLVSPDAKT